jgi:polyhydroxybutyrate depolymerase
VADNGRVRRTVLGLGLLLLGACAPARSTDLGAKSASNSPRVVSAVPAAVAGVEAIMVQPPIAPQVVTTVPSDTAEVVVAVDGALRTAVVHTPEETIGAAPMPLVIALHGSDGSGTDLEALTGYDDVADREGFVVAYADGLLVQGYGPSSRSWNSGQCCDPATSAGVDDVAFIEALIDRLVDRYPVDPERVFIVGHSNGAIMAQVLGCRLADRVAGIASVAGALDDSQSCNPSRGVPFLEIHGTYDQNVSWGAGEHSVAAWRQFNGCDGYGSRSTEGPVTTTTWGECRTDATVQFVSIDGAEHPWPSRRTPTNDDLNVSFAVDATEATWAFFSSVSPVQTASRLG